MRFISEAVVIAVSACLVVLSASGLYAQGKQKAKDQAPQQVEQQNNEQVPGAQGSFQQSRAWNKLDDRLQAAWLDAMKNEPTRRLDCFVRVEAPADRGDQSFLISAGYNVRMFSGPIASGNLKAQDLQDVAELPFVQSIRLSTK